MAFEGFQWLNQTEAVINPGKIAMLVPGKVDRFNEPQGGTVICSAPFFYRTITGDFILRARVSMESRDNYDGVGLLIMSDDSHWVKTSMEKTDFGTVAAASVVTNGVSDVANGPNIVQDHVWLQIAKKGSMFAVHYSLDGTRYDMIRICTLPYSEPLKAGFVAQAPVGKGGYRWFDEAALEACTVEDIRKGR